MKRWYRHSPGPSNAKLGGLLVATALTAALLCSCLEHCLAADALPLLMKQDDSKIMTFNKMKRVWVTNPAIIDVVVVDYYELLLYSKSVGRTRLYVWDADRSQKPYEYAVEVKQFPTAEQAVRRLSNILGRELKYTVVDDQTVLIEGEVASASDKDRIDKIVTAKSNGVTILNLVTVTQTDLTPAAEHRRAFEKLFPHQFRYSTIDEKTLVIEGEVGTAAERQRVQTIVKAATSITVVDLVRCLEDVQTPEQQRMASIKQAVGDGYEFMELEGSILVISGDAETDIEKQRIDKIVEAASEGVTVINVVAVRTDTRSDGVKYAEILKPVFGEGYTFTPLAEDGLIIEGIAASPGELARVKSILELVGEDVRIVDLVSTGPQTVGQRALAMLQESLAKGLSARLVAEDVVLVEGVAPTAADKTLVDTLIEAAPEDAKIVSLVSVQVPLSESWPASEYQKAIQPVLGDGLTYRVLDENTLLVEGEVATAGDKLRAATVFEAMADGITVLDLISVAPGPNAMAQSPAAKKAELLGRILSSSCTCDALDENTVLVQGVVPSQEEQQRLSSTLTKLAGDVTIVDMIVPVGSTGGKTMAQRAIDNLAVVIPKDVKLVALDESTVLIEGIVPTSIDKERIDKIAEMTSESANVNVLSLVLSEMQAKTPASRRIEHLKRILGDKYNYIVWDDDTVLVEGEVETQSELERVQTILKAADEDFKVGSLVTYGAGGGFGGGASAEDVVQRISNAIGEPYRVWHLKAQSIVIEGIAPDQSAMTRLETLIEAFADEASIINLVSVANAPVVPLAARAESLRAMLGPQFQVRTLEGKAIVVEGTVTDENDADRARAIIEAMGTEVPVVDLIQQADPQKRQIVAHVKVLDINRGRLKKLGINWGSFGAGSQEGTVVFNEQPFLVQVQEGVEVLGDFAASVNALNEDNAARLLAEPNLVVNEGESAEMVVGGEVPIPVPQMGTGSTSITIDYKEYGVVLKIKPIIKSDGESIEMEIAPEVSSIDPSTQVNIGGIAVPAFRTRKAKTVVDVPDGSTLVIGGLIQRDQSKVVRRIPILGKLPILGALFRSTTWESGMSELVILVTPEILSSGPPQVAIPVTTE